MVTRVIVVEQLGLIIILGMIFILHKTNIDIFILMYNIYLYIDL